MAGKTDFSQINADLENLEKRGSGTEFRKVNFKNLQFGDTTIAVLPPKDDSSNLYERVVLHFGFTGDDGNKRVYLCSRDKHNKCPICDAAYKAKDNGDTDRWKEIKPVTRYLWNGCLTDFENCVLSLKTSQHKAILNELRVLHIGDPDDEDASPVDATNPENGVFIRVSRMKADPWATAKGIRKHKKREELKERCDELLENMFDISDIYIDNSPSELSKVLDGEDINAHLFNKKEDDEKKETKKVDKKAEVKKASPKPKKKEPKKEETKKQETPSSSEDDEIDKLMADLED